MAATAATSTEDFRQQPPTPPRLLVSGCLWGQPVRYDGGDKRHAPALALRQWPLTLAPICPEQAAGLGVPRPPVQLVALAGALRARGVDEPSLDVTAALLSASAELLREPVHGAVLKARSPSCGSGTTPWFEAGGELAGHGDGLFVQALRDRYREAVVVDEHWLDGPVRGALLYCAARLHQRALLGLWAVPPWLRPITGSPPTITQDKVGNAWLRRAQNSVLGLEGNRAAALATALDIAGKG